MPQDIPNAGLNQEQLTRYYQHLDGNNIDAASSFLAQVLNLPEYRFDTRSAVQLDYVDYALEFAKQQGYGPRRTLSLVEVAQNLLKACTAGTSFSDAQATLKVHLVERCSPKPGLDSPKFSPDQIARIGVFFTQTLFRHYRLYSYVFSHKQDVTHYTTQLLVETPLVQSFEAAMPQDEWDAYVEARQAQQLDSSTQEQQEALKAEQSRKEQEEYERAQAEAERQALLAKKPATLEEAIQHVVALRLEQEKEVLASEYRQKEEVLLKRIDDLEAKALAGGAAHQDKGKGK